MIQIVILSVDNNKISSKYDSEYIDAFVAFGGKADLTGTINV